MTFLLARIKTLAEQKAAAEAAAGAASSGNSVRIPEPSGIGGALPGDPSSDVRATTSDEAAPLGCFSQSVISAEEEASGLAAPSPARRPSISGGTEHVAEVAAALERQEGVVAKLQKELALHKQLQKVLLQGDGFAGINRKIQLKPTGWDDSGFCSESGSAPRCEAPSLGDGVSEGPTAAVQTVEKKPGAVKLPPGGDLPGAPSPGPANSSGSASLGSGTEGNGGCAPQQGVFAPGGPAGRVTRCVVVAKWGGELTGIGRKQAEDLGKKFRYELYPGAVSREPTCFSIRVLTRFGLHSNHAASSTLSLFAYRDCTCIQRSPREELHDGVACDSAPHQAIVLGCFGCTLPFGTTSRYTLATRAGESLDGSASAMLVHREQLVLPPVDTPPEGPAVVTPSPR